VKEGFNLSYANFNLILKDYVPGYAFLTLRRTL